MPAKGVKTLADLMREKIATSDSAPNISRRPPPPPPRRRSHVSTSKNKIGDDGKASENERVRVGSLTVPKAYINGASNAGLGSDRGMYGHMKGLGGVTPQSTSSGESWDTKAHIQIVERDILDTSTQGGKIVSFDDIVALKNAKRLLNEAVVLPFAIPEFFSGIRKPWKGVLLFGPPGTGKTMLARAVCSMNNLTFFNCSAATLLSKYWGESEKVARGLFMVARQRAPSVIFFDEVDAIMSSRSGGPSGSDESSRRLKTEILKQMDGIESAQSAATVIVVAASNCPWDLDEAFRRRLEKRIHVPLPEQTAREIMIKRNFALIPTSDDMPCVDIAMKTDGFSGADMRILCREAAMMPVRRLLKNKCATEIQRMRADGELEVPRVLALDLYAALEKTRPSVSRDDLHQFTSWNQEFGSS